MMVGLATKPEPRPPRGGAERMPVGMPVARRSRPREGDDIEVHVQVGPAGRDLVLCGKLESEALAEELYAAAGREKVLERADHVAPAAHTWYTDR